MYIYFMKFSRYAAIALIPLGLIACAFSTPADTTSHARSSSQFTFGLWGDMPYEKSNDNPKIPALIKSINQSDIAFSIYDGDIKDGSSKCSDHIYTDALKMFAQLAKPVIYVPGDNEWTDCHRLNNGGFDGLERLAHIRRVMFPTLSSLGQHQMTLEHQGKLGEKFVENTRFTHGSVVFSNFNVPGSNNNLILSPKDCTNKSARNTAQCDASNAEFLERDAANVVWLEQTFLAAKKQKTKGIVIVFQADPGFDLPETEDVDESKHQSYSGYRNFMNRLESLTANFNGQVLLVHGDTHFFKIDKPLHSHLKLLPNLTRVQTFGSPHIHWVKVTVNSDSDNVFQISPVMVKQVN